MKYISLPRHEVLFGCAAFLAVLLLVGGTRLSRLTNTHSISSEKPVSIYLEEPTTLEGLADIMVDSGVDVDRENLVWAGRLLGWKNFAPGHYEVDGGYSFDVFLSRMARGIQDPVAVTLLPGTTLEAVFQKLYTNLQFDSTALARTLQDSAFRAEIGVPEKELIGRMLPDTYSFYWTASPTAALKRILREFDDRVVRPYRELMEELDMTVNEVVTMASIIEWEANYEEEKPTISGLYWNRLNRGMLLQADPTVNFVVGERRRLLYADYKIDHPYNTYMNRGLPPGPITNPGLGSIEAALFPEDHNYLYMVASPEGHHVFSETFEEHRRESARWREWLREQYRIKRELESSSGD